MGKTVEKKKADAGEAEAGKKAEAGKNDKRIDLIIALSLTAIGAVSLVLTILFFQPRALEMNPGVEGCLTTSILGMLLVVLAGVRYRTMLLVMLPVAAVQFLATQRTAGAEIVLFGVMRTKAAALAMLQIDAIVAGFLGVVLVPLLSRLNEEAPAPSKERTRKATSSL